VNGAALVVSMAETWQASAWDQNTALRVMAPGAVAFEDAALEWVRDLLDLGRHLIVRIPTDSQGRMREVLPDLDSRTPYLCLCTGAGHSA
jgi:hypothetical protein